MATDEHAAVTDSPWFWVLIFSVMGLLALAVIGGKYARRQANIERQYQARERVAERIATENNPAATDRIEDSDARREYATPGDQLLPIWPLAVLLGIVVVVAAAMLYRGHRGRGRPGSLDREGSLP
jgi:hypothetical protein